MVSDACVYKLTRGSDYILAAVHVDDIGFVSTQQALIAEIQTSLRKVYDITVNDDMKFFLGLNIHRDRAKRSIVVTQSQYIADMLKKYGVIVDANTVFPLTPMAVASSVTPSKRTQALMDTKLSTLEMTDYMARVGSLMYTAVQTRPDILFAVTQLARQTHCSTAYDMENVNRVLLYLGGTIGRGLNFQSGEGINLYATVDASYACHKDYKSHSGCTLHIGRSSASFLTVSKKQTITADSSTVAEFIAAHSAAKHVMWARNFLEELGFVQHEPTTLFEDNLSTIQIINNQGNNGRTKHIGLRLNFIREQVSAGTMSMVHLAGADMPSDAMTKNLAPQPFLHLIPKYMGP